MITTITSLVPEFPRGQLSSNVSILVDRGLFWRYSDLFYVLPDSIHLSLLGSPIVRQPGGLSFRPVWANASTSVPCPKQQSVALKALRWCFLYYGLSTLQKIVTFLYCSSNDGQNLACKSSSLSYVSLPSLICFLSMLEFGSTTATSGCMHLHDWKSRTWEARWFAHVWCL